MDIKIGDRIRTIRDTTCADKDELGTVVGLPPSMGGCSNNRLVRWDKSELIWGFHLRDVEVVRD